MPTYLGEFGKGVPGSRTVNFSESGGPNCDTSCRFHPKSTKGTALKGKCYAVAKENFRKNVGASHRENRELGMAEVSFRATRQLQRLVRLGRKPPFLRISAFGSVPKTPSEDDLLYFSALLHNATWGRIPVHFPVESAAKVALYEKVAKNAKVTIRLSLQNAGAWRRYQGACSISVGSMAIPPLDRLKMATMAAEERHRLFPERKVVVCPAIASNILRKPKKVKCGQCKACTLPNVDVVYPVHA